MKNNMKLMRIYQIEKNYQLHRKRLGSIGSTSNKEKTRSEVHSNILKINNFKKNRLKSETFSQKEHLDKINSSNLILHQKMIRLEKRENQLLRDSRMRSHSQSKTLRMFPVNRIVTENMQLRERLRKTRSNYHRQNSENIDLRQNRKQEVINLLEHQLGITPTVTFPSLRKSLKPKKTNFHQASSSEPLSKPQKSNGFHYQS